MSILSKIQTKLKAPKNQYNGFGDYKYRSLEDIIDALKPLLKEHEASLIIGDTIEEIGGRVYVKATAKLYDGEMKLIAENTAYAREPLQKKKMDDAQITGATSSYSRKYCLNGLFAIDDTKDADSMDNSGIIPAPDKLTQKQLSEISELMTKTNTEIEPFIGFLNKSFNIAIMDLTELTKQQAVEAIKALNVKFHKGET